jgi:oligopeptide transport system ATP-binding protein
MALLEIDGLRMHFPVRGGILMRESGAVRAVDGVSLRVEEGETVGLVGESGCGKTTLGRCVMRLLRPTGGTVRFEGRDITGATRGQLRPLRRNFQMIFQDPAESLNPRHTVARILEEPFEIQGLLTRDERRRRACDLLEKVGLDGGVGSRYPFEFSGGQRQRIGIARAIALNPRLVVCDEPVSALDVSVQSQVLNLMLDLQRDLGMSYLFIAHNLAVVRHVSDRVAIMYLGKIVELAGADEIYASPRHAYTRALIDAIPVPKPVEGERRKRKLLEGDVPSPIDPPPGCAFGHRMGHPRYPESVGMDLSLREVSPGHWVQPCPCCTG